MRDGTAKHSFAAQHPPRPEEVPMIVEFTDAVTAAAVYVNPAFVINLRPDPADPDNVSILKLSDGESVRVKGDHRQIADRLRRT
jgi:hypothetical protein